ncbi:MAG: N-acetylmuramic acid 6-phosphate etherase [Acidobacteria bacterium]|nr:N-acetylmuramic acid 6-phosphate etherase [Acidobacteriota bacterium]
MLESRSDMKDLITEQNNPNTRDIDDLPTSDLVRLIHEEDHRIFDAIGPVLHAVAAAIDRIAERLEANGRLIYVGTGTSGRLGVLDAVECPATFGIDPARVQAILAGGYEATFRAVEAVEDDPEAGAAAISQREVTRRDAVVGIAASGRTPFTIGAMAEARARGALTVSLSSNPDSEIAAIVDVPIEVVTGPEIIAGSTRMKAGTAQKMILNMISTSVMIKLGYTHGNLMSNLVLKSRKLQRRAQTILMKEFNLSEEAAAALLIEAGNDLKVAILMHQTGMSPSEADRQLRASRNSIKSVLKKRSTSNPDTEIQ